MPFLVMEFVRGKSLQEIMAEEGAMGPARAFELMQPICGGIAAAHRQKIVHRDLKPLNVMVQDDIPINEGTKILDFGLAKIKSGELLGSFIAAQTTGLMGSPFYMAPEQWSDEPPDAHADIYSLGVMLYQMLCGEVPFKGNSIPAIMKKHLTADVPSFASKGVEVPAQIEAVVRHTLEKEPEYRTSSAEEFMKELREAMAAASAVLKTTGDKKIDPFKTVTMSRTPAQPTISPNVAQTAYDPLAGTISGTSLDDEEEKLRIAREELAREADANRRLAAAEAERKRTQEAERGAQEERVRAAEQKRAEQQAREELRKREEERQRVEELVAKQTKAIEERLSKLAASIPPAGTAVVDPEATQVRAPGGVTVTENSYPTMVSAPAPAVVTAKKSVFPIIMIGLVIFILGAGGVGVWWLRSSRTPPGNNNLPPGTPAPENPKPPEPIALCPRTSSESTRCARRIIDDAPRWRPPPFLTSN